MKLRICSWESNSLFCSKLFTKGTLQESKEEVTEVIFPAKMTFAHIHGLEGVISIDIKIMYKAMI